MTPDTAAAKRPGLLLLAGALFLAHAAWLSGLAEDAFISFRYARNLAHGHGWVWNPGEAPVEGFTNLSWVLVGAGVETFGLPQPAVLLGLGVVAGLLTLGLADRFATRVLKLGGAGRGVTLLLLALSGPLAAWSTSGLETVPFTLAALATLYGTCRWRQTGARSTLAGAVAAAALATLTRPDGVLLMAVLVLAIGLNPGTRPLALKVAATLAVFLGLLTAWRLATFGAPLPNTFYAKTGGGALQALRGATYAGYFAFHFVLPLAALLAAALPRGSDDEERQTPEADGLRFAVGMLVGYILLHGLFVIAVGGDYMAMNRFFVPVVPALALLAGLGFSRLRQLAAQPAPHTAVVVLAIVATLGTGVHSTPLEKELYTKAPRQHGNFRGVETERWHVRRLSLLAKFFHDRAAGQPASLATSAIGVIGFESGLAVYDLNGLVDPRIARGGKASKALGTGLPGHEKMDPAITLEHKPTFWMFTRRLRDEAEDWPRYGDEVDEILRRDYEKVTVRLNDPANGESGRFTFLERRSPR